MNEQFTNIKLIDEHHLSIIHHHDKHHQMVRDVWVPKRANKKFSRKMQKSGRNFFENQFISEGILCIPDLFNVLTMK